MNLSVNLIKEAEKPARSVPAAPMETTIYLRDNGGRRSGIERRQFSYSIHVPERRGGNDRRVLPDRRKKPRLQ